MKQNSEAFAANGSDLGAPVVANNDPQTAVDQNFLDANAEIQAETTLTILSEEETNALFDGAEPGLVDSFVEVGNKFIRIWHGTSCWGFISRVDGDLKGSPIKKGDLLKAATWKAPAKHARGNIIDGTARYGVYGPDYL